jgi:hypothetical protein
LAPVIHTQIASCALPPAATEPCGVIGCTLRQRWGFGVLVGVGVGVGVGVVAVGVGVGVLVGEAVLLGVGVWVAEGEGEWVAEGDADRVADGVGECVVADGVGERLAEGDGEPIAKAVSRAGPALRPVAAATVEGRIEQGLRVGGPIGAAPAAKIPAAPEESTDRPATRPNACVVTRRVIMSELSPACSSAAVSLAGLRLRPPGANIPSRPYSTHEPPKRNPGRRCRSGQCISPPWWRAGGEPPAASRG